MAPDLDQQDPLREAFDAAETELGTDVQPEVTSDITKEAPVPIPEEKPWEAPDWTKKWKPEARDALGRFASNPEFKPHLAHLVDQIGETNKYTTQRDQEYADYRKRLDPLYETVKPYEQRYALQGMTVQQGIGQLLELADFIGKDPDAAFPWLAQTYRPKDANKALATLAQHWGADLQQVGYEQPYIDPTVSALLTPLQQEMQQMRGYFQQQQAQQQQAQQASVLQEISAFETAKDDTGQPLYPHFRECFDDMLQLVEMGRAQDLKSAYELATRYNPAIQEKTMAQRIEAAQKKAIEEAAARTAEANKAETASRKIGGKTKSQNDELTTREAYESAKRELGATES